MISLTFGFALLRQFIFDAEALGHAVERAPVNAHDFSGAGAVAAHHLEHVEKIATFEFFEQRQIVVEGGERRTGRSQRFFGL